MDKCAVALSLASRRWLFATSPPPSAAWAKRPCFGRCAVCAMRMCGERTQGVALRDSCLLPLSSLTILLVGPFRLSAWFLLPWLLLAPPLLRPPALPYPGCCPSPCFPNRFPLVSCLSSLPPVRVLLRFSEPPPSAPLPFWPFRVSPAPPRSSLHAFASFAFPSPCPLAFPPLSSLCPFLPALPSPRRPSLRSPSPGPLPSRCPSSASPSKLAPSCLLSCPPSSPNAAWTPRGPAPVVLLVVHTGLAVRCRAPTQPTKSGGAGSHQVVHTGPPQGGAQWRFRCDLSHENSQCAPVGPGTVSPVCTTSVHHPLCAPPGLPSVHHLAFPVCTSPVCTTSVHLPSVHHLAFPVCTIPCVHHSTSLRPFPYP